VESFLPPTGRRPGSAHNGRDFGLSNSDYAPLPRSWAGCPGRVKSSIARRPDTANMETIERYGKPEHKQKWLDRCMDRQDPQRVR